IPEYFNRHCSRWNKKDFLEEYKDKDGLGEKIGIYLRSLEVIADNEEGQRSIRARPRGFRTFKSRGRATKLMLGRGNIEGCLTFKTRGRPSINPTGARSI
ncbi:20420_t:CDS:2, partial [Gigaspora rosea]